MSVAWFGQLKLELLRKYIATEMVHVVDSYDVTEWSPSGGDMHKHSIDWTVDDTPVDIDAEMNNIRAELLRRQEAGDADFRLRAAGIQKFIKLAERYVSEWNRCKDSSGNPNALANAVRNFRDENDHPCAVSHADIMRMCNRPFQGEELSVNDAREKRLLFIAALSNAVCMHDMHLPLIEGAPHATAACARIIGANEDTGEKGHIECANGYPMELVTRGETERIEGDQRRPDLFHMRLARNCKIAVGGNEFFRIAACANEATKIVTHRRGAVDYVAKYQTDGDKTGGGDKHGQIELVRTMDSMRAQGETFGNFLTSSFMKLVGNAAFPITKVFHYLLQFPTSNFSRPQKNSVFAQPPRGGEPRGKLAASRGHY